MAYKIRPGVEMVQVCGQYILVATREIWEECPQVRPLPMMWSLCCKLMMPDETEQKPIRTLSRMFRMSEEEVRERLKPCLETLSEEGFLLEVPDEEQA